MHLIVANDVEKQFYECGAATVSITPKTGVDLYALDGMVRKSDKIHSELNANAITISLCESLLVIVSLDLIWIDKVFTEKVRNWVNLQYKDYDIHLLLVATHSHSTPQVNDKISNTARPDKSYLVFLYNQVCVAIKSAIGNKEQCYAEISVTYPNLTVNRRKKILSLNALKRGFFKTLIANRPNFNGVRDFLLYTVWFYDSKGSEKAVLLNYACHPTLFRRNAVSADFPGIVSSQLKSQLSERLVVCFLQGFTGDIKANLTKSSCFNYRGMLSYVYSCLFDNVQFDKNISQQQLENFSLNLTKCSLERHNSREVKPKLHFFRKEIKLPLCNDKYTNLEISYVSLGDRLDIIALGGEIFSEYSLWLRSLLSGKGIDLLTIGYCNDMVGYIPTYKAIQEGGYEVERAFTEFSQSSPFSDRIENIVKKEIKKIITENIKRQ